MVPPSALSAKLARGIVHKNEYVIPEWMRADPQVLQVKDWLETRRQRGFQDGGPTTAGYRRASEQPAESATGATSNAWCRCSTRLTSACAK